MLLEWFWSLVKLHTFQCSHNCLTKGNFEFKIWKTVKIREKILIYRGKVALLAGDQNIFIFKGGCPIRAVNFLGGGPPLCTMVQERATQWWGFKGGCPIRVVNFLGGSPPLCTMVQEGATQWWVFKGSCPIRVVNFLGGGPPLYTMVQEGATQWWGVDGIH